MNEKINLKRETIIREWVRAVSSVYSLAAIQQYFYTLRIKALKEAKTQQEMDEVTNKIEDILYGFEIAFEGDYAGLWEYYNSMSEECKLSAAKFGFELYDSIVEISNKDLAAQFSAIKMMVMPKEYASVV